MDVGFVGTGSFKGLELRCHHLGTHEVALARPNASFDLVTGRVEENEAHVARPTKLIAVATLQRGARDDQAIVGIGEGPRKSGKPRPTVVVGEWLTSRHLVDVRLRVRIVGVEKAKPQMICKGATQR